MWPAHAITLSRIPIAIAFWFAIGNVPIALALLVVAAVSDAVDGNVARRLKRRGETTPDIGGWLDPLVDKIFVAIVVGAIWWHTHAVLVLVLIGARELVLVPLVAVYLANRGPARKLHADWLGKIATIAQFVALAILVAAPGAREVSLVAASATAALGLAAAAHYVAIVAPWRSRSMHSSK